MAEYVVTTPNTEYKGRTYGVKFDRGQAVILPETVDANVGLSADQIAERMREMGYTVTVRGGGEGSHVGLPVQAASVADSKPAPRKPKSKKK